MSLKSCKYLPSDHRNQIVVSDFHQASIAEKLGITDAFFRNISLDLKCQVLRNPKGKIYFFAGFDRLCTHIVAHFSESLIFKSYLSTNRLAQLYYKCSTNLRACRPRMLKCTNVLLQTAILSISWCNRASMVQPWEAPQTGRSGQKVAWLHRKRRFFKLLWGYNILMYYTSTTRKYYSLMYYYNLWCNRATKHRQARQDGRYEGCTIAGFMVQPWCNLTANYLIIK